MTIPSTKVTHATRLSMTLRLSTVEASAPMAAKTAMNPAQRVSPTPSPRKMLWAGFLCLSPSIPRKYER